jgi:hypothetical protein
VIPPIAFGSKTIAFASFQSQLFFVHVKIFSSSRLNSQCRPAEIPAGGSKATPLIPLEIFYLHAPPPVDERADFIRAIKPAMDFILRELKPGERPENIRAGFINFMKPRWDVFSDPQYKGKKSTYPVWFLHMLTYFIEVVMPRLEKHKILVESIPEASSKSDEIFIVQTILHAIPRKRFTELLCRGGLNFPASSVPLS